MLLQPIHIGQGHYRTPQTGRWVQQVGQLIAGTRTTVPNPNSKLRLVGRDTESVSLSRKTGLADWPTGLKNHRQNISLVHRFTRLAGSNSPVHWCRRSFRSRILADQLIHKHWLAAVVTLLKGNLVICSKRTCTV